MVHYIIIKKNGDIEEKTTRSAINSECIYKLCGYKSASRFVALHTFSRGTDRSPDYFTVYGKRDGRANSENKYEFPPPIDSSLFFGTLCIIKMNGCNIIDLVAEEWLEVYNEKFGGFEDLSEVDEERSIDSELYSDEHYTKEGYHKDSFVIDDAELMEEEYI